LTLACAALHACVSLLAALLLTWPAPAAAASKTEASVQLEFGVKMATKGLWREAVLRFEKAASVEPNRPEIFNNLAVAYECLGRFDDARQAYEKALELNPSDRRIQENQKRFLAFYESLPRGSRGP
jgi:Flp pilus assembly protein TadD